MGTTPTSFKLDEKLKARLDKYNSQHEEQPLILSVFINKSLEKWLKEKGY